MVNIFLQKGSKNRKLNSICTIRGRFSLFICKKGDDENDGIN